MEASVTFFFRKSKLKLLWFKTTSMDGVSAQVTKSPRWSELLIVHSDFRVFHSFVILGKINFSVKEQNKEHLSDTIEARKKNNFMPGLEPKTFWIWGLCSTTVLQPSPPILSKVEKCRSKRKKSRKTWSGCCWFNSSFFNNFRSCSKSSLTCPTEKSASTRWSARNGTWSPRTPGSGASSHSGQRSQDYTWPRSTTCYKLFPPNSEPTSDTWSSPTTLSRLQWVIYRWPTKAANSSALFTATSLKKSELMKAECERSSHCDCWELYIKHIFSQLP